MLKQHPEAVHDRHVAACGQATSTDEKFVEHPIGGDHDLGTSLDGDRARLLKALLDRSRGLLIRLERELVDRRIDRDRPCEPALEPIGMHHVGVVGG